MVRRTLKSVYRVERVKSWHGFNPYQIPIFLYHSFFFFSSFFPRLYFFPLLSSLMPSSPFPLPFFLFLSPILFPFLFFLFFFLFPFFLPLSAAFLSLFLQITTVLVIVQVRKSLNKKSVKHISPPVLTKMLNIIAAKITSFTVYSDMIIII